MKSPPEPGGPALRYCPASTGSCRHPLLEHKRLIRAEAHYSGSYFSHGYLTTRAGRDALANGTLEQILASG